MIKVIAIDDEPLPLEILKEYCRQVKSVNLVNVFTQTNEARAYLEQNPVDLLFLDIQMPSISGIEFYKALPKQPLVIFTTAFSEYAVEGFEVNAIDYLLKPYSYERFATAVAKAQDYLSYLKQKEDVAQDHLFVKADYSIHKIMLADILYIEGLADYLKIHLATGKVLIARMTMKGMLEKLPVTDFTRVHRSFIVPLKRIISVRNKVISLGSSSIPIGESYEKEFFRVFVK